MIAGTVETSSAAPAVVAPSKPECAAGMRQHIADSLQEQRNLFAELAESQGAIADSLREGITWSQEKNVPFAAIKREAGACARLAAEEIDELMRKLRSMRRACVNLAETLDPS